MLILGIESSCDETGVALVEDGKTVLYNQVLSQVKKHARFGGVIPEIAAREHLKALQPMMDTCLKEAALDSIDAIAVTAGPGLIGALLVGVSYAKALALATGKPLIPVNHVHAHVHGALLGLDSVNYPCLALVVSGGHTNLYMMEGPNRFQLLAHTLDDACGECFDKVAKLFQLGYPGGPLVEKAARSGDASRVPMPRVNPDGGGLQFSYSGLKTYMVNWYRRESKKPDFDPQYQADGLAAFQDEALGQLVRVIVKALKNNPRAKGVIIAGGVAANLRLRELLDSTVDVPAYYPALKYCGDNAAMIAALAYHQQDSADQTLSWDCYARYPYGSY